MLPQLLLSFSSHRGVDAGETRGEVDLGISLELMPEALYFSQLFAGGPQSLLVL